jgi:large subunit ribosomal protein L24
MKIKKNDIITVISGNDKGKSGKVLKVFPKQQTLIAEKINFIKRHTRPTKKVQQGGILQKEAPIHISKVMLICNKCGKKTKVRIERHSGKPVRICKKCKEMIDVK